MNLYIGVGVLIGLSIVVWYKMSSSASFNEDDVTIWKGKLIELKQQLSKGDSSERVTLIQPRMLASLMEACSTTNGIECKHLGTVNEPVSTGSYGLMAKVPQQTVTKEKVRIRLE